MPLALREIMIVLRAKDQASRVIAGVGQSLGYLGAQGGITAGQLMNIGTAMVGAGVVIGGIGAAGLAFFNSATVAAADYNKQAAQTKTQVDGIKVSVEELSRIGLQVAKEFPVAFEEIQPTFYDIFSSMNVGLADARNLLKLFAVEAVAGNTSMQTAGRATIAILNAYGLSAKDAGAVSDLLFQLVRKGVGTYEEFTTTIGRAIPAARASNQNLQTLGGTMAFLTRNGLSTAMSATSAARAFELLTKPDVTKRLEAMGVSTKDANGNFRQMNDIITQLAVNKGWAKMTGPELKQAFQDTFGTGTAQARRFFDTAIPLFDQYNGLVGDMNNTAGATLKAYAIMFDQPANKVQLMKNRIQAYRIEIGEKLLPIKEKLLAIGVKILDWWSNLSPRVQNAIMYTTLFVAALMAVVGPILIITGLLVTFVAMLMFMGAPLWAAIAIVGGLVVGLAALAGAIFGVTLNWETVKKAMTEGWDKLKTAIEENKGLFIALGVAIAAAIFGPIALIGVLVGLVIHYWSVIKEKGLEIWNGVKDAVEGALQRVSETFKNVWADIQAWWNDLGLIEDLKSIWASIQANFGETWGKIANAAQATWDRIRTIIVWAVTIISAYIQMMAAIFNVLWDIFGGPALAVIKTVWKAIVEIIKGAVKIIAGVINLVLDVISGDWEAAWEDVKQIFAGVWDTIVGILRGAWNIIYELVKGLIDTIVNIFQWLYDTLVGGSIVPDLVNAIIGWFTFLWDAVVAIWQGMVDAIVAVAKFLWDAVSGGVTWLFNFWKSTWTAVWDFLKKAWNWIIDTVVTGIGKVLDWVGQLPAKIMGFFVGAVSWLLQAGKDILQGLWNGALAVWDLAAAWLGGFVDLIGGYFAGAGEWLFDVGKSIIDGLWGGMKWVWNHSVAGWLGGLAGKAISLKGPPTKDATLLVNNGRLIMQSLQKGMQDEWANTVRMLQSMSGQIGATMSPTINTGGMRGFGGAGSSVMIESGAVQIIINGNPDAGAIQKIEEVMDDKLRSIVEAAGVR